MTVKEFYEIVGGDYNTALSRMMNDDFIKRMLSKFHSNNGFESIIRGYERKDFKALFEGAHSLKGVAGNLALTNLYNDASVVTEATRDYENIKELNIDNELNKLEESYLLTKSKIEELLK